MSLREDGQWLAYRPLARGHDGVGDREDRAGRLGIGVGLDDGHTEIAGLAQGRSSGIAPSSGDAELLGELRPAAASRRPSPVMFSTTPSSRMAGLLRHHRRARQRPPGRAAAASSRPAPRPAAAAGRARSRRRPVPGGMSTTSVSSSPQWTSERNCSSARWSIGPRHMTGALSSRKKPIDMNLRSSAHGRHDHLVDDDRALVDPEHVRDRVAVDVRVEHARPAGRAGESAAARFDGERGLADTALAAGDSDHARATASSEIDFALGRPPRSLVVSAAFSSGVITSKRELDGVDARQWPTLRCDLLLETGAQRAAGDRQRDRDRDVGRRRSRHRGPCRAR